MLCPSGAYCCCYKQLIPATEPYQLHLSSSQGPHQLLEPEDVRRQTVVVRDGETMASLLSLWTPEWTKQMIALIISIFSLVPLRDKSPTVERSYCWVTYNPCPRLFPHLERYYCTYSSAPVVTINIVHHCYLRYLSICDLYVQNPFQTQLQYKERQGKKKGNFDAILSTIHLVHYGRIFMGIRHLAQSTAKRCFNMRLCERNVDAAGNMKFAELKYGIYPYMWYTNKWTRQKRGSEREPHDQIDGKKFAPVFACTEEK